MVPVQVLELLSLGFAAPFSTHGSAPASPLTGSFLPMGGEACKDLLDVSLMRAGRAET